MNRLVETIPPSAIRMLNDRKRADAIDLGMGQPQLHPDMAPLEAALKWIREHGCPYSQNAGFVELRAAIAQHFAYPGLRSPEQVCITIGSQEALYLPIKALLDPSLHEALVVTPTFPAYQKLCHIEGIRVVEVQLDPKKDFAPDAAAILSQITDRTRLVAIASPCNPTGRVWPESELRKLSDGLLETLLDVDQLFHSGDPSAEDALRLLRSHLALRSSREFHTLLVNPGSLAGRE
ncbi:MAG TPA: pyridoxal phosphate-dependent aminotransferase [Pseudomonadota bacterium]|nr:pyridoxal phosphate-dependent aminotransferase [Pseudomonadota bacterium]